MKRGLLTTVAIVCMGLYGCGGGGDGDGGVGWSGSDVGGGSNNENQYIPLQAAISGKVNGLPKGNYYLAVVELNDYSLPVRHLFRINPDGTFHTTYFDTRKDYAIFIQDGKNNYVATLYNKDGQILSLNLVKNIYIDISVDNGKAYISANSTDFEVKPQFQVDNNNNGVPFFADFEEINEFFGRRVFFDPNAESFNDDWAYMHYKAYNEAVGSLNANFFPEDPAYFVQYDGACMYSFRYSTSRPPIIRGKIFRRLEGIVPVYVPEGYEETHSAFVDKLKFAIEDWNLAFSDIDIEDKIKFYYAGEVVDNKQAYNTVNDKWRGIITKIEPKLQNTVVDGSLINISFFYDQHPDWKLEDVYYAFYRPVPFDYWKGIFDYIENLYDKDVFVVEYRNDGYKDIKGFLTGLGKPMNAVIFRNDYVSISTMLHELGHMLGLYHPFYFDDASYRYYQDLIGKPSVMNYYPDDPNYPEIPSISDLDKQVLKYVYSFSTDIEITKDNAKVFLETVCP